MAWSQDICSARWLATTLDIIWVHFLYLSGIESRELLANSVVNIELTMSASGGCITSLSYFILNSSAFSLVQFLQGKWIFWGSQYGLEEGCMAIP
jgi:hypothetical protein